MYDINDADDYCRILYTIDTEQHELRKVIQNIQAEIKAEMKAVTNF